MATVTPTLTIKQPNIRGGGGEGTPRYPGGDGNGRGGDNSPDYGERLRRYRLGLAVGIAPIIMLFVAFTSAYIVRSGMASWDPNANGYVNDWFPVSLPTLILAINTVILLVSSFTMEKARRQAATQAALAPVTALPGIAADERPAPWLTITVVLGIGFLVGQILAWRELAARGFFLSTGPSSSFVCLLTGMHAIHLAGGVLALLYSEATGWLRKPIEARRVVIDTSAWYWHFMAVLWIYIFALIQIAR